MTRTMSEDFHNAIPKVALALKNVYNLSLRGCDELAELTKLRRNVFRAFQTVSKPRRPRCCSHSPFHLYANTDCFRDAARLTSSPSSCQSHLLVIYLTFQRSRRASLGSTLLRPNYPDPLFSQFTDPIWHQLLESIRHPKNVLLVTMLFAYKL